MVFYEPGEGFQPGVLRIACEDFLQHFAHFFGRRRTERFRGRLLSGGKDFVKTGLGFHGT
jgi:hypothetical protein